MAYHQTLVAGWLVNTKLVLDYKANNKREETVLFSVAADLQPIVTLPDPADVVEQINISGADVGIPIDGASPQDVTRYVYFQTDRGLWSLEYLISVACAHLRIRARTVSVSWDIPFAAALDLSCRKNATLFDDRFPAVPQPARSSPMLVRRWDAGSINANVTMVAPSVMTARLWR